MSLKLASGGHRRRKFCLGHLTCSSGLQPPSCSCSKTLLPLRTDPDPPLLVALPWLPSALWGRRSGFSRLRVQVPPVSKCPSPTSLRGGSLLPRMPFSGRHGHHSGLPSGFRRLVFSVRLRGSGKGEGGQAAQSLEVMAVNFQEVRRGPAGGRVVPGQGWG